MPKGLSRVNSVSVRFDSYKQNSIKQVMQLERAGGEIGRNLYITNMKKKMVQNTAWCSFLRNDHNKTGLISALVGYFKSEEIFRKFSYPIIITEEEKTWLLSSIRIQESPSSNHVEADTRIIMEALKKQKSAILKVTDTDIIILMCYAHSSQTCTNKWIMNIDSERFVIVNTIQDHFGKLVCNVLPAYHSITGCDTTSYVANRGKDWLLNKMIKRKK